MKKNIFDTYSYGYNDGIRFGSKISEPIYLEAGENVMKETIAKRMIRMDMNTISDLTFLSKKEIRKLKKILVCKILEFTRIFLYINTQNNNSCE